MMARLRILAVPGSLRRGSYNAAVLESAARLASSTVDVRVFEGLPAVPLFNEDIEDDLELTAGVEVMRRAVAAADGLVVATPEYNQAVPGVVKNMVDWLSRSEGPGGLDGLPVAVTGATTGPWGTRLAQTMLRQMLHSTGARVMPTPTLFIAGVRDAFDGGNLVDASLASRLQEFVAAFGDWIRLVRDEARAPAGAGSR